MSEQSTRPIEAASADPVAVTLARARAAMAEYGRQIAEQGQPRIDEAVTALAWSIYEPGRARRLAEIAVEVTGIGELESKVIKNQRKTFGTLRDLLRVKSTGIIEELPEKGIVKWAKPAGVVAAITPSTNPSATPVNKAMMAIKGGNAIVIAPPPSAWAASEPAVAGMRAELERIGLPADLVQILPAPVTRDSSNRLMQMADLVVCTGSQVNVRAAYKSGKPALGVGLGNVPVIIDASADLRDAAHKIMLSKTFDHALNALELYADKGDAMLTSIQTTFEATAIVSANSTTSPATGAWSASCRAAARARSTACCRSSSRPWRCSSTAIPRCTAGRAPIRSYQARTAGNSVTSTWCHSCRAIHG